jgi:hypothetical protein
MIRSKAPKTPKTRAQAAEERAQKSLNRVQAIQDFKDFVKSKEYDITQDYDNLFNLVLTSRLSDRMIERGFIKFVLPLSQFAFILDDFADILEKKENFRYTDKGQVLRLNYSLSTMKEVCCFFNEDCFRDRTWWDMDKVGGVIKFLINDNFPTELKYNTVTQILGFKFYYQTWRYNGNNELEIQNPMYFAQVRYNKEQKEQNSRKRKEKQEIIPNQ